MIDSLNYLSRDPGEVWKIFCEIQEQLPKALLFITKGLNSAIVFHNNSLQRFSSFTFYINFFFF